MEKKFNRGKEMLVEKLDLPKDVILDVPKIIVIGRNNYRKSQRNNGI